MKIDQSQCVTLVGMRGSGKSHKAREIVKSSYKRTVIFDPVFDWHDGIVVTSFVSFGKKLKELKNAKNFKIIFRLNIEDESRAHVLNEALRLCYLVGDMAVVIDEIQLFVTPHYMPPFLENLYFVGRHKKVGVLAITQRPSKLNKSCLSQSDHVFVGQLHEKNDIAVVSDFLNESTQSILATKKRQFIYFSPDEGKKLIK